MRYFFLLLLFVGCSNGEKGDLSFEIYNQQGEMVKRVNQAEIKYVTWDKQCYHLAGEIVNELRNLNLLGGNIHLVFKGRTLTSISVVSVYASRIENGYFVPCREDGYILIDKDEFCLQKVNDKSFDVSSDREFFSFLEKEGLLRD